MTVATDRDEIRDLAARYAHYVDANDGDRWVRLFTEDASFVAPSGVIRGHSELRAYVERRAQQGTAGRHIIVNLVIDVEGDSATMSSYLLRSEGNPPTLRNVGVYHDVLQRENGAWRFASRTFTPDPPA